jgi:hypothetical protein
MALGGNRRSGKTDAQGGAQHSCKFHPKIPSVVARAKIKKTSPLPASTDGNSWHESGNNADVL